MRRLLCRLGSFLTPGRAEDDLARETAAHLVLLEDDYKQRGMSADQARTAARRAFGGIEQMKDRHRDARSIVWIDDLRRDLRHAVRLLQRNPIFTLTAAFSLAIGIGANTTIFTVVNRLLFRNPAGVAEPDRLVDISQTDDGRFVEPVMPYASYLDIRRRAASLETVFGYQLELQAMSLTARNASGAERIFGAIVTENYLSALGVHPALGRLFDAGDSAEPGASPIAVLSHAFWTRRFNADPSIVGQTVRLTGQPFTVIGVAADGFQGTSVLTPDVWVPAGMAASFIETGTTGLRLAVSGRLKSGMPLPQAAIEVEAIGRALALEFPDRNRGNGLRLVAWSPLPPVLRLPAAAFLAVLTVVVSAVLMIACANVAGVLLARALARRREIAVRLAIGAGRARLVRQLLTETLLLFIFGGTGGLLLARGMTSLLVLMLPPLPVPIDVSLPLDGHVVAFTAGLSLLAAILAGLAPAMRASRTDVVSALKDDPQGPADRSRLRHAFVVAQVACSVLLVVGTGLLVRGLRSASWIDLGYEPSGVEVASLDLSLAGYTSATGPLFIRELVERVRQLPGVQSATLAQVLPMGGSMTFCCGVTVPGATPPNGQPFFQSTWNAVEPGYFSTLRIPLLAGRDFAPDDRGGAPGIAIVSEAARRQFWPELPASDVVGRSLLWQTVRPGASNATRDAVRMLRVIGVAGDLKPGSPGAAPRPLIYIPLQQEYTARVTVLARSSHGQRLAGEIRALLAAMNSNLPIVAARMLAEQSTPILLQLRVSGSVSGAVGLIGLLLATIGIYGVTMYAVARRTREIGIRIALGARRADVVRMILRQGMTLVATGVAIGLILGAGAGRLLAAWLLGVPALDIVTSTATVVLFTVVGLAACYIPARRATQVDPMTALRCE